MKNGNGFGTSEDMVIRQIEMAGKLVAIAIDEKGLYITTPDRIGRNLADVNRYGVDRSVFVQEIEEAGLDPVMLFEENKDRIVRTTSGVAKKMVNPIKASKRGGM